jgi:hypothetical protein
MSYFTQMVALTVQNFVSAATGMAVVAALALLRVHPMGPKEESCRWQVMGPSARPDRRRSWHLVKMLQQVSSQEPRVLEPWSYQALRSSTRA